MKATGNALAHKEAMDNKVSTDNAEVMEVMVRVNMADSKVAGVAMETRAAMADSREAGETKGTADNKVAGVVTVIKATASKVAGAAVTATRVMDNRAIRAVT